MITPSGRPIWSRTASTLTYGGHPNKRDYGGIGAVNALTDVTAAQLCRLAEDVASLAMVAPLFRLTTHYDYDSGVFVVTEFHSLWGAHTSTAYNGNGPASGFARVQTTGSTGNHGITVTLPSSPPDSFGVTEPVVIRAAFASAAANTVSLASISPYGYEAYFLADVSIPLTMPGVAIDIVGY